MKKVAIFDVDGTIFRSSLLIELTEAMISSGLFKPSVRRHYAKHYQNWLNRKGSYEKYINAVVEVFEKNIKGKKFKDFLKISKKVISLKQDHIYEYTRDLIKDLKKRGCFLLAISNSPKLTVDYFCQQLGFDKTYGRMRELDEKGVFTGKLMHEEIIWNKAKVLKRAMGKEGLTLKNSFAVGDTESDIPLFKMVDYPICFNPNKKLYNVAKKNGWKVVVERKDMIYEIN